MKRRETDVLYALIMTLRDMSKRGVMLDQPDDSTYVPISVQESDLGAFHLPRLEEIMGFDKHI